MLNQYIEQLKSPDPAKRREAIIALGKQKDAAALKPLAEIYQNDPDPALRELAFKAGRYIRSMTTEMSAVDAASDAPRAAEPRPALSSEPASPRISTDELRMTSAPEVTVKPAAVERARGYFNQAMDLHIRHQDTKAIEALGKAIEANPNLRNDTMFVNLAMELTGMGSGAAMRMLTDPTSRKQYLLERSSPGRPGDGEKLKRGVTVSRREDEADSSGAVIDLAIYGLVNGAVTFIFVLIGFEPIFRQLNAQLISQGVAPMDMPAVGVPLAAVLGLISGLVSAFVIFLLDSAIHLVATTVLGGSGTLAGLIRKTTMFYTIMIPVSTVISGLPFLANSTVLMDLSQALSTIVGLGVAIWAGKLTGDAYDFGMGKGCMASLVGYIVLVVGFVCCIVVTFSALAGSLGGQ